MTQTTVRTRTAVTRMRWPSPVVVAALSVTVAAAWWFLLRTPAPAFTITRDIEYASADGHSLKLDLYLPAGRNPAPPIILWLHGGGWRYGDKSHVPLRFLASEGYAIASIDYRLSPNAPFPAQIHDCKAAVRWIKANAAKHRIDPSRIVAAGESAGAHLALLLGTTGNEAALDGGVGAHANESTKVAAVIDFFGSGDLTVYIDAPVGESTEVLTLLLGGPLAERRELARQASPVHWISAGDARALVLHGKADDAVPLVQSQQLIEQFQAANVKVTWHFLPTAGHNTGPFLDEAGKERIRTFLRESVRQ